MYEKGEINTESQTFMAFFAFFKTRGKTLNTRRILNNQISLSMTNS